MIDWKKLIEERDAWVAHNFPNPTQPNPGDSIHGCIEELGELTHAMLKMGQNIRGDAQQHTADARDAVGDLSVYLMGVMSWAKYEPNEKLASDRINGSINRLAYDVGRLGWAYEGVMDRLYYLMPIDNIVRGLRMFCEGRNWSYEVIVLETWAGVKQRDWILYPTDGVNR